MPVGCEQRERHRSQGTCRSQDGIAKKTDLSRDVENHQGDMNPKIGFICGRGCGFGAAPHRHPPRPRSGALNTPPRTAASLAARCAPWCPHRAGSCAPRQRALFPRSPLTPRYRCCASASAIISADVVSSAIRPLTMTARRRASAAATASRCSTISIPMPPCDSDLSASTSHARGGPRQSTGVPGAASSTVTVRTRPSTSAVSSMPSDTRPLPKSRGSRLQMTTTRWPTSSSGA